MRRLLCYFPLFLVGVGLLLLAERPAYGYTDPGTGLLAIQAMGSAMVAAGWYLRRKIYTLFHRNKHEEQEPEVDQGESAPLP